MALPGEPDSYGDFIPLAAEFDRLRAENARLRAANARLRVALNQFVTCCETAPPMDLMVGFVKAYDVAKKALEG
jgi:hypothetical protein